MWQFLELGELGKNQWWRYILTLFLIFIFAIFLGYIPTELYIDSGDFSGMSSEEIIQVIETDDFEAVGLNKNWGLITMLVSFYIGILTLYLCYTYLHKKKFLHLFNPQRKIRWKHFLFGFLIWGLLILISIAVDMLINTEEYVFNFSWTNFLPLLLICIFMLPIQVLFEELLVRGYIMQGLYTSFKIPFIPIIGSTLFFCFIHVSNPEIQSFGWYIMLPYYFGMGLLLAIITVWDKGIEIATGIHTANNVLLALIFSYEGAVLQTDSIWIKTNNLINYIDLLLYFVMFLCTLYATYHFINRQEQRNKLV